MLIILKSNIMETMYVIVNKEHQIQINTVFTCKEHATRLAENLTYNYNEYHTVLELSVHKSDLKIGLKQMV